MSTRPRHGYAVSATLRIQDLRNLYIRRLETTEWLRHIRPMEHPRRDYRYRLRKYPRRRGVIWRWFIFEGGNSTPVETGILLEPDRDKAEAAAKEAIERLRRMPPSARSPGVVPGAVSHNDPEDHAAS